MIGDVKYAVDEKHREPRLPEEQQRRADDMQDDDPVGADGDDEVALPERFEKKLSLLCNSQVLRGSS
jgi:hypothetical protein